MLRNASCVVAAVVVCAAVAPVMFGQQPAQYSEASTKEAQRPRTRNVAIVVHEGVELLDFAGPGEVFAAAQRRGAVSGVPWFKVYTVAPKDGPITAQGFVEVVPQYTIANCPPPDILVIPGGETNVLTADDKFMAWVRDNASSREITLSVCTGAFVLSDTGLLDGKEATTHWGSVSGLRQQTPNATVHGDKRFIDNGSVITTAGISAGIDGSLHVVARLLGLQIAQQTARYMEYDWNPDPRYVSAYSELNPQLDARGQALQKADLLRTQEKWPEAIAAYEAIIKQYPEDADAWYYLGYVVHAKGDIDKAIEIHTKAASFGVRTERPLYNLACAYALKGDKDKAIATLQQAIDAGFRSKGHLMSDHDLDSLRDDPRFTALLDAMD